MSTLLLTLVWAVLIVIGAVALLALGWLITGRCKNKACGTCLEKDDENLQQK